jgi:two-component system chemotaxis sensor kinase CheA
LSNVPTAAEVSEPEDGIDDLDFKPLTVALPILDEAPADPEPPVSEYSITFKPHAGLYAKANEPAVLLRELERLGEIIVECDKAPVPSLADLDPEVLISWTIELKTTHDEKLCAAYSSSSMAITTSPLLSGRQPTFRAAT